jgi:hypothetical protein
MILMPDFSAAQKLARNFQAETLFYVYLEALTDQSHEAS